MADHFMLLPVCTRCFAESRESFHRGHNNVVKKQPYWATEFSFHKGEHMSIKWMACNACTARMCAWMVMLCALATAHAHVHAKTPAIVQHMSHILYRP